MRILFEGFWWCDGPPSGRHVLREMVTAWQASYPSDDLLLAVPAMHVSHVQRELGKGVEVLGLRARPQAVAAAVEAGILGARRRVDVVLTQNYAPVIGRGAVFLHDVLFQSNPEWFTTRERAYFAPMTSLARRATVFTSSQSEAARITRHNPRITPEAVGLGLSSALTHGPSRRPLSLVDGDSFVLSAGRLNVRKNLERLVEAAVISSEVGVDRPLLIVGERQGRSTQTPGPVADAVRDGIVRFLGHVSDEELRWLYHHAELFAFVSLDEGFGLPPLEALKNSCPVLASDITVLRENLGVHATYCNPLSIPDIALGLDHALRNPCRIVGDPPGFSLWQDVATRVRDRLILELTRGMP